MTETDLPGQGGGLDSQTFRDDGTYQITRPVVSLRGQVEKKSGGFVISWTDGGRSWVTQLPKSLSVTTNGTTDEYRQYEPY